MGTSIDNGKAKRFEADRDDAFEFKAEVTIPPISTVPVPMPTDIHVSSATARATLNQINEKGRGQIYDTIQIKLQEQLAGFLPIETERYFTLSSSLGYPAAQHVADLQNIKSCWEKRARYLRALKNATQNWFDWTKVVEDHYEHGLIESLGEDLLEVSYDKSDGNATDTRYHNLRTYFSVVEHSRLYGAKALSATEFENQKERSARSAKEAVDSMVESSGKNNFYSALRQLTTKIEDAEGIINYAEQLKGSLTNYTVSEQGRRYVMTHDVSRMVDTCRPG